MADQDRNQDQSQDRSQDQDGLHEILRDDVHPNTSVNHEVDGSLIDHDPGRHHDIFESEARELIEDGFAFAEGDDVTVQAQGTELSTSMDDLAELGVDHVLSDGDLGDPATDDLILALGLDDSNEDQIVDDIMSLLGQFDEAVFDSHAEVGVMISEEQSAALSDATGEEQDDVVNRLLELGVDYVQALSDSELDDLRNPDNA